MRSIFKTNTSTQEVELRQHLNEANATIASQARELERVRRGADRKIQQTLKDLAAAKKELQDMIDLQEATKEELDGMKGHLNPVAAFCPDDGQQGNVEFWAVYVEPREHDRRVLGAICRSELEAKSMIEGLRRCGVYTETSPQRQAFGIGGYCHLCGHECRTYPTQDRFRWIGSNIYHEACLEQLGNAIGYSRRP